MAHGVARGDGDASGSVAVGAGDRADSSLARTVATGQASEHDWSVFQTRTVGYCVPSYLQLI